MSQRPEMIWHYKAKLSGMLGGDDRPSLHAAWLRLDKKGNWIIQATNSFVMAWMPVDIASDAELRERAEDQGAVYFPLRALLELERGSRGKHAIFQKDGSITIEDVTFHIPRFGMSPKELKEQEEGPWPTQPKPIPAPSKLSKAAKNRFEVGFNVDFLKAAAGALESPTVRVIFDLDNPQHQIWIRGLAGNPGEAIVMPVRLDS